MQNKTSLIDRPKKAEDDDLLGIDKYKNGLIKFIKSADTPLTIAIQGEWGSGKTSIMNSLRQDLCGNDDKPFYAVWINTWHHTLALSSNASVVNILIGLIQEVMLSTQIEAGEDTKIKISNWIKRFAKVGTTVAGVVNEGIGKAGDAVIDMFDKSNKADVSELKDTLQILIDKTIYNNRKGKKGILFFIDDLDRIDPPLAVQFLELLKNIFDLEHCIFILAIDYDVVVKGLKPKFGELTEKNEREFRSFFDKIIQLPFSMPVASYVIDKFLTDNLHSIGYIEDQLTKDRTFLEKITKLATLSVGTNPRAIKRLLNSISLINIINKEDDSSENEPYEKLLNFGLVCIQIAYPFIYRALSENPVFPNWKMEEVVKKYQLRTLTEQEIVNLNQSNEFDEEWEKALFLLCEKDYFLSRRVFDISRMLNEFKKIIPDNLEIEKVMPEIISLSSVTDVQSFDKPKMPMNEGDVLRQLHIKLLPLLQARRKDPYETVQLQGKKIVKWLYYKYDKQDYNNWIEMSPLPTKNGIQFVVGKNHWLLQAKSKDAENDLRELGKCEVLEKIRGRYAEFESKYKDKYGFSGNSRYENSDWSLKSKTHVLTWHYYFSLPDANSILEDGFIDVLADFITDYMDVFITIREHFGAYENFS